MSQHPSLKGKGAIKARRSVLKRFERVEVDEEARPIQGRPARDRPAQDKARRLSTAVTSQASPTLGRVCFLSLNARAPKCGLNRFLAAAGLGSRRACEALIRDGRISINGHFIRESRHDRQSGDDVRVAGKPQPRALTTGLHPPCTSQRAFCAHAPMNENGEPCFDLVPSHFGRLFHVGTASIRTARD